MAGDGGDNTSQQPLAGVITCCTSIEPERRADYASMISEMGGVNKLDLTSDVTHLIVGDYDTPKYKYVAKERSDVKCVLPEWIDSVREAWMAGGETDVESLEKQYKVPAFHGAKVSVTGFQDLAIRQQIQQAVKENGGEYTGDLTKEVTHLIAHTTSGAKYIHAKQWGIHVVSIEWLQHSLERGMILEESLYDPLVEASARGKGAWIRKSASVSSLGKRAREDSNGATRKLRRTASAKFSSQSEALWGDIVGGGFSAKEAKKDEWDDVADTDAPQAPRIETRNDSTLGAIPRPEISSVKKPVTKKGIFGGKRFFLHGFDAKRTAILEKHLYSSEADVLPDIGLVSQSADSSPSSSSFVLVPHTSSEQDLPHSADVRGTKIVNEFWLEKCLHSKQYVDPDSNPTYKPFTFPITGFEKLRVSSTGFEDIDLLHIGKTIRLLGGIYTGDLLKSTSALICSGKVSSNRQKIQYALKWDIPIVKAVWLDDCLKFGGLKPLRSYLSYPDLQKRSESQESEEAQGDIDFHNPKRALTGARKKEADYGKGPRSWLRRKEDKSSPQGAGEDDITIQPLSVGDSFAVHDNKGGELPAPGRNSTLSSTEPTQPILNKPKALRERSPNSPPKNMPENKPETTKPREKDSLSTAISSLLAARQREASAPSAIDTGRTQQGRRKRTLLGRANSNLSSRSHLSRASSVDTLNTDGVGTPVEGVLSASSVTRDPLTEALLGEARVEVANEEAFEPPMTQVEYQEEDAEKWREKVARRMGWKKVETDEEIAARLQKAEGRKVTDEGISTTRRKTRGKGYTG